jgi:hypothetical protein
MHIADQQNLYALRHCCGHHPLVETNSAGLDNQNARCTQIAIPRAHDPAHPAPGH